MDNKSTTKRMIGAVVLVLIAALLLAWLLKGKNKSVQEQQELIAEQTQDATPILGFPGVSKDGEEIAEGQLAQNGEAAQDGSGSYVIGAADQQTAQNALATGSEQVADGSKATGEVVLDLAAAAKKAEAEENATGFQVRDSQGDDATTEKRQIVDGGTAEDGTGSMGANEVATADQTKQAAGGDTTQTAAASGDGTKAADDATQSTVAAADASAAKTQKTAVVNPKLVNEKPVPAPRTQSARKSADKTKPVTGSSQQVSASKSSSGSSGSSAASQSNGAKGYAIQVLAASSLKKAETVQKDIARDGYPAFVVRANVNGKTVYRVRVGTYPVKGAARAVQTRMKARYSKNQYVQNSFVTKN